MARILIIDDEPQIRAFLHEVLTADGHQVQLATDGYSGLALYRRQPADVVITDIYMPGMDGVETVSKFRQEFPAVKIIAISGGGAPGNVAILAPAGRLGANKPLAKPFNIDALLAAVDNVLAPAPTKKPSVFARPPVQR